MEIMVNDQVQKSDLLDYFRLRRLFFAGGDPLLGNRAYLRTARPYEAKIVDFVRMEGSQKDGAYFLLSSN